MSSILKRLEENREKERYANNYYRGYIHALRDVAKLIDKAEHSSDESLLQERCEAIVNREILETYKEETNLLHIGY